MPALAGSSRGARRAALAADVALFRFARGRLAHPSVTPAIRRFSSLGEHAALWLGIGVGGAVLDTRRRERWVRGLALIGGAYAVNTAIKVAVGRDRPQFADLPALIGTPTRLSFPSAHATSSFCAAAAYRGLLPGGMLHATAAAMAASRVILGVHFPSDIAVGAALGTLIGRRAA